MTSEDRPPSKAREDADPLDEETEKLSRLRTSGPDDSSFDPSNTTTWAGSSPPRIIDEEEATVVSAIPEPDADATETMVTGVPTPPIQAAPIAPSSSLRPMLLERVEPSLGRGERLRLDAAHWQLTLGRAEESDVRLYTASASREHASIAGNEQGEWILTPLSERTVHIDGELVTESVVLETGMNILLGQDHLRCVTEGLNRSATVAATKAEGFGESEGWRGFQLGGLGVMGLVGLVFGAATLIGIAWAVFR